MAQILNQPYDPGSTGEAVKSGIQGLIDHHVQKKAKQNIYESQYKVAKALGLNNPEGLAYADPHIFEQIVKQGRPESQASNPAFNEYVSGGSQPQGGMQMLQQGMEQPQQSQPNAPEQQQPQSGQFSPQAVQGANDFLSTPEAQQALGPEKIAQIRQNLGGQPGAQAQNELGGSQPQEDDQQLYEKAIAGTQNAHQLNQVKAVREARTAARAAVKLEPLDEKYAQRVESRAEIADDIEPILDEIERILDKGPYSSGNPDGYNTGYLESISPVGLLKNSTTQDLNNAINALLLKQTTLESQGKGSDLLRNIIKDGKLSLAQTPDSLNRTLARLKSENKKDQVKSQVLEDILNKNEGRPVANLRAKVKKQLKQETELFIDEAGQKWKMVNGKAVRA